MPATAPYSTSVIGSLPRPQWVIDLVNDREKGLISEEDFQSQLDDAVLFAIRLQDRAGIDCITDGEWRRRAYFTGFSAAVTGFQKDVIKVTLLTGKTGYWPGVVGKLRRTRPIAVHEGMFVKRHTKRRVKVTLPSPYMVDRWFYDPVASRDAYPTREALIQDAADVLREELIALRDAGVDIVQFDDAMIGRFIGDTYNPSGTNPNVKITMADRERELEMATAGMNRAVKGVTGITTTLHVCRGHRARMRVAHGGFEPLAPFLFKTNVNILALELAADDAGTADALRGFPEDKTLGMGVIDVLSREVDPPEKLAARVRDMQRHVPPERISLNPDCGFAPSYDNPITLDEAYAKLSSVSAAAGLLREPMKKPTS